MELTPPTRFDPWDPAHRADPHALYHRMRAEAPVYRASAPVTGNDVWFLTRYADVQRALRHPDLGREADRLPPELAARYQPDADITMIRRHILNLDPPDHTRLRRLMTPAFGARTISALEPRIAQITTELVAAMAAAGEETDLIEALALPLPVTVIAELLGIPIDDRAHFRELAEGIVRPTGGEHLRSSGRAFATYISERVEERRARPGEDLLSQLIEAEDAGERLSYRELISAVFLLLLAGHETTVNLIGNGTLELLRHPGQLARLRAQPGLIGSAVEEILRFNGPVEHSRELFALADVALGGAVIPRGAVVVPLLLAANRDPAVFDAPDVFDIGRHPNRHLGFGHGIHFCLGAPLARMEGRIAIDALVRAFGGLALAADPARLEWTPDLFLRGLRRLPVRLS